MTTYNTGNNLGSTDPRDLYDNAENLDNAVNDLTSPTWKDRRGNTRTTLAGQIGYIGTGVDGAIEDYAAGQELTTFSAIIRYNGEFYRPSASASLPYTTTTATPDVDANLVPVGDATLRQDLANPATSGGSDLVAHAGTTDTVTEALDKRTIYVGSVAEGFSGLAGVDGQNYSIIAWHPGGSAQTDPRGGGEFVFKSAVSKSEHNGGTVISPTVPPVSAGSVSGFLNGTGETDPTGTGCFVRLNTETMYPTDFGARTGTSFDSTASFQALINYEQATVSDRSFTVNFRGAYQISSTLLVNAQSVVFSGSNYYRDILFYNGTGYCIDFDGGECRIENMRFIGNPATAKTNDAVICGGNLTMMNAWFVAFRDGIQYGGGFYHKYYNCKWIDVDYPLVGYNANNMLVSGSQFANCIDVIDVIGGTGNCIFHGCSLEGVTGDCFTQSAGSQGSYSIFDNYFENCNKLLVAGRGTQIFCNNNIQVGSMSRGVSMSASDPAAPGSLYAVGNKWIVSSDGFNAADYIYLLSGTNRDKVHIDDFWMPTAAPSGGANETIFEEGASGFNSVSGKNALTGLGISKNWTPLTLLNGWVDHGSTSGTDAFAYKEHQGVLYIRGRISGAASTSGTVATLPQEIYERVSFDNTYWFAAATETPGAATGLVRSDNGSIVMLQQVDNIVINFAMPLL